MSYSSADIASYTPAAPAPKVLDETATYSFGGALLRAGWTRTFPATALVVDAGNYCFNRRGGDETGG